MFFTLYLSMMRRLFFISILAFFSSSLSAHWVKINDADYVWGPFNIYNISLYSETGQYQKTTRPLMLALKYAKPVDGRDFAISLARSWSNLGITLENQDEVVDRLRKIMPNIRNGDLLSYIALADRGYFVLNDIVIPEEFNQEFNDAVVAVWLDERVEIGRKLLNKIAGWAKVEPMATSNDNMEQAISAEMLETATESNTEKVDKSVEQADAVNNQVPPAVENIEKVANPNVSDEKIENQQSESAISEPETASNSVTESSANEHQSEENTAIENKESEQKTGQTENEIKPENKMDESKREETLINYPNPESEIQPPFDPIPFEPLFK